MKTHIGPSGWTYAHWRDVFYPPEISRADWLDYYAECFNTVELNASFYRFPRESTFANWYRKTPSDFLWSVKANRFITHIRRLKETGPSLEKFFISVRPLREKIGVILFQLPPSLGFQEAEVEAFCRLLPPGMKCAIEARNREWFTDEALAFLEEHGIAWCISDTAGRYPYLEAVTADFTYIRLHGSRSLYASDYREEELVAWARKIQEWNRETYVYFDNDFMAHAPHNALRLKMLLDEARC